MISSILCAVDGSEHADKAVDLALDLAKHYNAKLSFVHVLTNSITIEELSRFSDHPKLKKLVEDESLRVTETIKASAGLYATPYVPPVDPAVINEVGETILEDAKSKAEDNGIQQCTTTLVYGNPADEIVKLAKTQEVGMVILGHRGLGTFRTFLMGSVANKVSHLVECTCISVK